MEQKTEALYLINGDKFLHLRENGAGVGFATYDCATGEPQEFGQISKLNLPPDGRNAIPAARKSASPAPKLGRCTSNAGIVVLDKTADETMSIIPKSSVHAVLRCEDE